MASITPLVVWRPKPESAPRVAAPPYDVLNSDEARKMVKDNPLSFLRVTKPEVDFPSGGEPSREVTFQKGRENLDCLIRDGVFVKDATPRFFVYRLTREGRSQTGLVAGTSIDEYRANTIRKHEHTRPDKVEDRTLHMKAMDVQPGPVFLAFKPHAQAEALLDDIVKGEPLFRFTAEDGVEHAGWAVDQASRIEAIQTAFRSIPVLYIADGHHRTEAAAVTGERLRQAGRSDAMTGCFLSVIFPATHLRIMDYNRLVADLNGLAEQAFLDRLNKSFMVAAADDPHPPRPKTFGLFLGGKWHRLEARPGTYPEADPIRSLDVSILQENLLGPILGIADPRTDKRIDFVGGVRGLAELERRCKKGMAVAFALFPTSMDELMRVADANQVMPPKSTWFEPKLRSGLFLKPLSL